MNCAIMENRRIEIVAPTGRAWEGMKRVLFKPFEISKWFVLGFTAFLASLMDGGGSSGGNFSSTGGSGGEEMEEVEDMFEGVVEWIQANLEIIVTIAAIIAVFVIAIWVALLWVSSRGKFMFLDNVVHNRAQVAQPWKEFRWVANSLFRWRVLYLFGSLFLVFGLLGVGGWIGISEFSETNTISGGTIGMLVCLGLVLILFVFLLAYVRLLQEAIVVPLMYNTRARVLDAWKETLQLQGKHFFTFVLFFLWQMLLNMGAAAAMMIVMIVTCCVAAIVFMIPYLGAVALLPVSVFFRMLSLEFVRQFGEKFDVWKDMPNQAIPEVPSFPGPDLPPRPPGLPGE